MKKIILKTTVGFLSLGLIVSASILASTYISHDGKLTYMATNNQKASSLKELEQEIKEEEEKKDEALKVMDEASRAKEEAILELKNAKTDEEKKLAQEKIDAAYQKLKQAESVKNEAEKNLEEKTKQVEQNKQLNYEKEETENSEGSNQNEEANATLASSKENTTTTTNDDEEEQGSKFDLNKYPDLLNEINKKTEEQKKEIEEEAKKKTVDFHFYTSSKELTLRCRGDHCGENQQGYIWFVELECDLNKCEGFTDSLTGNTVSKLLLGRRGDITNYTVTAPNAKYGYKFVGWELVSTQNSATNELGSGAIVGKYIATYEKIQ